MLCQFVLNFKLNMVTRTPEIDYKPEILSEISSEEDEARKYSCGISSGGRRSYAAATGPKTTKININMEKLSWTKVLRWEEL